MSTKHQDNQPPQTAMPEADLLADIGNPADLRRLSPDQLPQVCRELREFLISNLSANPGHFGSSMGAVEIIVALHYVFNTPYDRIVWDVGHQAYAHKILTGRKEAFRTQRTKGGISGFPTPLESEYDSFIAGHAGNSISAALGMAIADMNTPGQQDRHTVAVIGDASIGNGLAFEGLNNAASHPNNLLIILNDNDMSIDNNVGALHGYLSELTTSAGYNKVRAKVYNQFRKHGLINDRGKGIVMRFNNSIKALISKQQNMFEGLNIRYFGPFDGHDVKKIVKVLNEIKDMKGPRILHLSTKKGKGYKPAEENPSKWHSPGKFDPATGNKIKKEGNLPWQEVFGMTLVNLAEENQDIQGITAAMTSGTSMFRMQERFPERTFDVGISEGHAVTFAGGLAAAGKHPFVAIYSSFLQRAYDSIIHDVAIQGLPVTFCIDRAGVVGEDGVTHHGLYDLAYLRTVPDMTIGVPRTARSLCNLMVTAARYNGPMAIRYPRGASDTDILPENPEVIPIGRGECIFSATDEAESVTPDSGPGFRVAILGVGPVLEEAVKAASDSFGALLRADVYDMIWVKPLDNDLLGSVTQKYDAVITIEDGTLQGGVGSAVAEWFADNNCTIPLKRLGIPDRWVGHASVRELHHDLGLDAEAIRKSLLELLNNKGETETDNRESL